MGSVFVQVPEQCSPVLWGLCLFRCLSSTHQFCRVCVCPGAWAVLTIFCGIYVCSGTWAVLTSFVGSMFVQVPEQCSPVLWGLCLSKCLSSPHQFCGVCVFQVPEQYSPVLWGLCFLGAWAVLTSFVESVFVQVPEQYSPVLWGSMFFRCLSSTGLCAHWVRARGPWYWLEPPRTASCRDRWTSSSPPSYR